MHVRWVSTLLIVSATLLAQSAPPPCPADRPVDEIIAEVAKQQSNNKKRNKNPLPETVCVWGWCTHVGGTPPTLPQPAPTAETPTPSQGAEDSSSSKAGVNRCAVLFEMALEAAHNVEVGDYYFEKGNFKAALMRYEDAAEQKTGDAAIHVRLGRVYEKVGDVQRARTHYEAAEKIAAPKEWSQEARSALARLQH